MRVWSLLPLTVGCLGLFSFQGRAQGCSDAGFCTMGAMKPNQSFSRKADVKLRSFEISQYAALTKFEDKIFSYTAEANFGFGKAYNLQLKLPYFIVSGPLANTHGLGDLTLSLSRNLVQKSNYSINATLGGKVATNRSDKKSKEGLPLPMYYQSSLGTYDAVAGISINYKGWLVATGIQHAFNSTGNEFFWEFWDKTSDSAIARKYPQSRFLKRGTDVMLRVEKNFQFSRFNVHIGLLPIYRLNHDVLINTKGKEVQSAKSYGTALSGIAGIGYRFSTRSAIKILMGARIIQRDRNPDGLSRELVNTIGYEYRF